MLDGGVFRQLLLDLPADFLLDLDRARAWILRRDQAEPDLDHRVLALRHRPVGREATGQGGE